ncbi:hypothetical protein F4801DRAFT_340362 [Xylaria longipes]|nr:hypothetical protein F4801DRAFT_340362 [Xylaria longipes]
MAVVFIKEPTAQLKPVLAPDHHKPPTTRPYLYLHTTLPGYFSMGLLHCSSIVFSAKRDRRQWGALSEELESRHGRSPVWGRITKVGRPVGGSCRRGAYVDLRLQELCRQVKRLVRKGPLFHYLSKYLVPTLIHSIRSPILSSLACCCATVLASLL